MVTDVTVDVDMMYFTELSIFIAGGGRKDNSSYSINVQNSF